MNHKLLPNTTFYVINSPALIVSLASACGLGAAEGCICTDQKASTKKHHDS
jgi:hypothetical protein